MDTISSPCHYKNKHLLQVKAHLRKRPWARLLPAVLVSDVLNDFLHEGELVSVLPSYKLKWNCPIDSLIILSIFLILLQV